MENHINVLAIASNACNLDCTYCYRNHSAVKTLKFETFEKYMRNMDDFFAPETHISVLFHGGEPLLAGYDFYEKAFALLHSFERKIGLGIQTNLTLLDEKTVQLFKENRCGFGASLDGDDEINSKTRLIKNSDRSSYQIVVEKINLLKKYNMSTGIISVITEYNMEAKRFYRFAKDLDVWSITPNPIFEFEESNICTPDLDELSNFMIQLFDLWIADENPPKIDFFERVIHTIMGAIPVKKCVFTEDCTKGMMSIDVDGEVYLCTHWLGRKEYSYGNALTMSFEKLWNSSKRLQLAERGKKVRASCGECGFWDICHGGCMSHTKHSINEKDYFCKMYRRVFSHIEKTLKETIGI